MSTSFHPKDAWKGFMPSLGDTVIKNLQKIHWVSHSHSMMDALMASGWDN